MAVVPGLGTTETGDHGPYMADAYNSLPTLTAAEKAFRDLDVQSQLHGPIRDIFFEHGVQDTYGIALLHRHFPIESTHRLVEHNGISVPWQLGDETSTIGCKWGGVIKPRSLRLFDGAFRPYEFLFKALETQLEPTNTDSKSHDGFFKAMATYLREGRLETLLGLGLLEGHKREVNIETTEGKANIMLPEGSIADTSLMPAFWIFGGDDDRCNCFTYCPMVKGEHQGEIHGCG